MWRDILILHRPALPNQLKYILFVRSASEMTYIVSSGALNSTHSLSLYEVTTLNTMMTSMFKLDVEFKLFLRQSTPNKFNTVRL